MDSELDDDYDFKPTNSSNLASLFGISDQTTSSNVSLTYTAPKQPKPTTSEPTSQESKENATKSDILSVLVVAVWKLLDGKYENVGKLGLAIINYSDNLYQLILYRSKKDVIAKANISKNLQVVRSKDNFISFYDSSKQNWLIKFTNENDSLHILKLIQRYGGSIVDTVQENSQPDEVKKEDEISQHKIIKKNSENSELHIHASGDEVDDLADNRTNILNRIAKLGQSILPTVEIKSSENENKIIAEQPNDDRISLEVSAKCNNQMAVVAPTSTQTSFVSNMSSPVSSYVMGTSMSYDPFSLLFSETRTHNSEVRLNINQINDKLNQVLRLVESKDKNDSEVQDILKSKIKGLQLKSDNLTLALEEYSKKCSLLQEKCDNLEKELNSIKQSTNIQSNPETIDKDIQTDFSKDSMDDYETFQIKKEKFTKKVKSSLSELYDNICSSFGENGQYAASEINLIVAQNIKKVTKKIIQQFQEVQKLDKTTNTCR